MKRATRAALLRGALPPALVLAGGTAVADEASGQLEDLVTQERRVGDDAHQRHFLIGRREAPASSISCGALHLNALGPATGTFVAMSVLLRRGIAFLEAQHGKPRKAKGGRRR